MARSYTKDDEPVPGFRLVAFLGRGGFGEVWKATAPGGTEAAIKIINLSGKQGLKEFRAIRLVKRIRHPNLVPLYAFWLKDDQGNLLADSVGEQNEPPAIPAVRAPHGRPQEQSDTALPRPAELIIAMGLGEKNLLDRMEECQSLGLAAIPVDELLNYMEDAAKAIDFLNSSRHDMGSGPVAIQHCDIKPQNIMIVGGAAQVCDFGLARVLSGDIRTSLAAVSPAYGAPECLKSNRPSQSTDQYSLAISYVELRTGQLPFEGDSYPAVINAHLNGTLDLSRLPQAERTVIQHATALDPNARFPSAMEMVRALRRGVEAVATARSSKTMLGLIQAGSELVPGYKLLELLGRGGFGEVWEATAPGGKRVAVKIIRNLGGTKGKREFKALELIKGVDHNHLMELHAYWLLDDSGAVIPDAERDRVDGPAPSTLVIVGKLAKKNLLQRLEECRQQGEAGVPVRELLQYMRQTAEAIDYLNTPQHRLGDRLVSIQHRDIKPENILLAAHTVKVGDFGLAKVVEGRASVIHADSRGLTLAYAAPEVFQGEVTRWTDQYSLAVTYFQLRTGTLPFDPGSSPFELMELHRNGQLDLSALSDAERTVIARATSVTPERRFESCLELVSSLEAACGLVQAPAASPATGVVHEPATVEPVHRAVGAGTSTDDTAPQAAWTRGTAVTPLPPAADARPKYRETATIPQATSTTSPEIDAVQPSKRAGLQTEETQPQPRAYREPRRRRFPLSLVATCLVILAGGAYLGWSLFSDDEGSLEEHREAQRDDGKKKAQTSESAEDKLGQAIQARLDTHDFVEAIRQISSSEAESATKSGLRDRVREAWVRHIEQAMLGDDLVRAARHCGEFLRAFPSDANSAEIRKHREHALTALISEANALRATDELDAALHRFDQLGKLLEADDASETRVSVVLGRARTLARQPAVPLDEIRRLFHELGARDKLPDVERAYVLAIEAIAFAPDPKDAPPEELDASLAILIQWDRDAKFAALLDPWERDRCARIVSAVRERAQRTSAKDALALVQQAAKLGFTDGGEMTTRVRQRISLLSRQEDFLDTLREIDQAISTETPDGWMLACRAECLLEQGAKPGRDELRQARASAYDLKVEEAGSYGHYVRALVLHHEGKASEAADELLNALKGDWQVVAAQRIRRDRVSAIVRQATDRLRVSLPLDDLGRTNPFGTPENAERVFRWSEAARGLAESIAEPLTAADQLNLALAAWYRTARDADRLERDIALVRQTTDELIRASEAEQWGNAADSLLLVSARSQEDTVNGRAKAIESYARVLERHTESETSDETPPLVLYQQVLGPALQIADTIAAGDHPDPELRRRMARLYSTAGRLIGLHRYLNCPLGSSEEATQKAIEFYDQAVKMDPTQAKYFVGRAYARTRPYVRSRVPPHVLDQLEDDAKKAIELQEDHPGGYGVRGYVLLLRSRDQRDAKRRAVDLESSVASYLHAINLSKDDDEELTNLLISSSAAHTELANNTIDLTKKKQRDYLLVARSHAERAKDPALKPRYPEYAWEALGNALEDLAWIVGDTPLYSDAVQAFTEAINARDDLAKSWLNRGRCQYKRVAFGGEDPRYLDRALEDLKESVGKEASMAEAYYWLGKVHFVRAEFDLADEATTRATELSAQADDGNWPVYAVDWALVPLYDANARGRRNPKDPEISRRIGAARDRAERLRPHNPAKAAHIIGQSFILEGNAAKALEAYSAGLDAETDKANPWRVELLIARCELVFGTPALLQKDVAKPEPQAIADADEAAEWAMADASRKAYALSLAAQIRIQAANAPETARASAESYRQRAVDQLGAAIDLAPSFPNGWFWRALLARQLKIYIDRSTTSASDRDRFRARAVKLLDEAIATAPQGDRPQIGELRAQISGSR